nr:Transposase InsD for insertion element IS2 [Escherichia coli]
MGAASQNRPNDGMPAINAKRVYRIMCQNALLLERKTAVPPSKRAHTGKVAVKEKQSTMVL